MEKIVRWLGISVASFLLVLGIASTLVVPVLATSIEPRSTTTGDTGIMPYSRKRNDPLQSRPYSRPPHKLWPSPHRCTYHTGFLRWYAYVSHIKILLSSFQVPCPFKLSAFRCPAVLNASVIRRRPRCRQ